MREIWRRLRGAWRVLRHGDESARCRRAKDQVEISMDNLDEMVGLCFLGAGLPECWHRTATSQQLATIATAADCARGLRATQWEAIEADVSAWAAEAGPTTR
jgi:hypothetical protein